MLISPNSYLGDYLTRKGPDARPIHVLLTYVDVIDPRTGQSLWSDSSKSGSWRVTGATKSLVAEFRARIEAEEGHYTRMLRQEEKPVPISSVDSSINK